MNKKCICCKKKLEVLHNHENAASFPCVSGAVVFRSSGQYGSRLIDGSPEIQVLICDQCLLEKNNYVDEIFDIVPGIDTAKYKKFSRTKKEKEWTIKYLKEDGAYRKR